VRIEDRGIRKWNLAPVGRPARLGFLLGCGALLAVVAEAVAALSGSLAAPKVILYGRDKGVPFHTLRGVAMDPTAGEIYVADAGRHEVVIFDTSGNLRGSFIHRVPGPDGPPVDGVPMWLAADGTGNLLISDERVPFVSVVDFRGRPLARLEVPAAGDSPRFEAGAIAIAPNGDILVASRGDVGRVQRFSSRYQHLGSWGVAGTDSGQIGSITGITVAADGRVFLTCALTRYAVQVFDPDGRFLAGFGTHDLGEGTFSMPSGVAATADGRLWVVDQVRQVVQVFSQSGSFVGMFGGLGTAPGEFKYPSALASDGGGLLVVAERVGNRVQVWRTR
jgi:DNA-binding beta-propeller fold protein YncE